MPSQELIAVLPLHQLIGDSEVAHLEVETDLLALARQLTQRRRDLLDHILDRGDVRQADRCYGAKGQRLDLVLEQVVHLRPIMPVETTNCLFAGLVKGHFPIHLVKKVIIYDDKDGTQAQFQSCNPLCVREALVQRVSPLVRLKDRTKDGKVGDLYGFLLLLNHVSNAFCNATPDHVEETECLALCHLKRIKCGSVPGRRRLSLLLDWGGWVPDKGQVELRKVPVKEAWIVHALFEESEFGVR